VRVVGVDPGMTGAMALIDPDTEELLGVEDFVAVDGRVMAGRIADVLAEWAPDLVVIEGVHSMPGQGVSTTFKFGRAFGTIEGIVAAMRVRSALISPHTWKATLGVTRDKSSSRAMAARVFAPSRELFARVKDDGRAEAALIALAYVRRGRQKAGAE
jgi:crossover junction endodeoxyribonuclease RuvC